MTPEEAARFAEIERRLALLEAAAGMRDTPGALRDTPRAGGYERSGSGPTGTEIGGAAHVGMERGPSGGLHDTPGAVRDMPSAGRGGVGASDAGAGLYERAGNGPVGPGSERGRAAAHAREERSQSIETAFGLTWLSRIAVLTIVLALAFFFKYAFENHWISESGRLLLGIGAGAVALGFGERFWRVNQRSYGQALTAAGVCFLYLSCWAAFGLYHVVSQTVTFTLMVLVTAGAGALAVRYDSAAVAMLGLAGGFATPLLLGSEQNAVFVFGYALVLDIGASFAARLRRWRWTEMLALAGTIILFLDQASGASQSKPVFTFFVLAWYVLFAVSEFVPVFLIAQVLAGVALVDLWAPDSRVLAGLLLMAAGGLAVADWRKWSTAVTFTFTSFWLSYGIWQRKAGEQPIAPAMAVLTASYVLFLAWPIWWVVVRERALRFQDLLLVVVNAALYFGAGYNLMHTNYGAYAGLFAVAVAVVQMGAARWLWMRDGRGSLLSAGAAWVLLVLAAPIQFAGYRVSIAWAIEGAALTWIGTRLRDNRVIAASLMVFVLVCGRLAALDSLMYASPSDYGLLGNARFLTFVVAAACFWAAAWWIREGAFGLVTYLGGHFVMLWGLCLEAAGWAERGAVSADIRSAVSMSISVLVAAYAVLLVGGGVAQRSAITRIAGIVLIGLVVLKLYLYDVWLLGQFYRMTAFAILGVLLLAMSYLYSRFRGTIESWWRP